MKKLKLEELGRKTEEEAKSAQKSNCCIVLDNIRSMHNVGSVFRTSDAFLVEKLYLCGITAQPPHREIEKTALGATRSVIWEYAQDTTDVVKKLKEEGYEIYAIEQTNDSIDLFNFAPDRSKKYAFIMGNEVEGVSDNVIKMVDQAIEIPQFGAKHSFNVSVTTGIVLWDYFSKIRS